MQRMTVADLAPWITPAVLLGVFAWLRFDIRELRDRMDRFDDRLRGVEQDLSEMKGKLTFIENYILRRNEPAPDLAE